jgi:hypothetical protein
MTTFQKVLTAEEVLKTPFSSYLITEGDKILYFTHTFVELSGIKPSQSSPKLSDMVERDLIFDVPEDSYSIFNVFLCHHKSSSISDFQNSWVKELIRELRKSSPVLDQYAHVNTETRNLILTELSKTLTNTSHRHKIGNLVASDLFQLIANPLKITSCDLFKTILRGWNLLKDPNLSRFKIQLVNENNTNNFHSNPIVFGNEEFLSNFFNTLLIWLHNQTITVEIERDTRISARVCLRIPFYQYLSAIESYQLINKYSAFIAAYFNFRYWVTQSSFNYVFPLALAQEKS